MLAGLSALAAAPLSGCGGQQDAQPAPRYVPSYGYAPYAPAGDGPAVAGLNAVIDISHSSTVGDFATVRSGGILAVLHKATEGGDWADPLYAWRREQARAGGLLWGAYHFGTRQYPGAQQAVAFLAVARPDEATVLALDLEPNERRPGNTMTLDQAEEFVRAVYRATGRLPMVYLHPSWADGDSYGRAGLTLGRPIGSGSILARCDLWLADYHEEPTLPSAWAGRGWQFWQYAGDNASGGPYGGLSRSVPGVNHCDRNLFRGDAAALYRYWNGRA